MESNKMTCSDCRLRNMCLTSGLNEQEIKSFEKIVKQHKPLQRGQKVFQPGDPFDSIYIVRSGSIQTYITMRSGEQQVLSFNLPGELAGFDGVSDDIFTSTAETIEMTSLCEIPFTKLEELSGKIKTLQHQLHRIMSKEILTEQQLLVQLGKINAERRVAVFLLNISERMHARGFSAKEFQLPMTRGDIGNYLGLAVETVSRQFTHFQEEKIIAVSRKRIVINDIDKLRAIANLDNFNDKRTGKPAVLA